MKREWSFLINVFLAVTSGSFRLAFRITKFHCSILKSRIADAFILGLYTSYTPIHDAYVQAYNKWKIQMGIQISKTNAFEGLLKTLSSEMISKWMGTVISLYGKKSGMYTMLFPHNSNPFHHGEQSDRLDAVKQLIEAIGGTANLAPLKAEIQLFFDSLDLAFDEQKGAISDTSTLSKQVEDARVAMCVAQFANLGGLMQYYAAKPLMAEDFFDLRAIRRGEQVLFMGSVKILSSHLIVQRTFDPDDELSLENDGVTELRYYIAADKDAPIGATFISIPAGDKKVVKAGELGDVKTLHFLKVYNPDDINKGEFTVEVI